MSTTPRVDLISVQDYLAGERETPIKHEYVGGVVYAMAGARNLHNTIEGNTFAYLHASLRGRSCRPYNSNTKIRIRLPPRSASTPGRDAVIPLSELGFELPLSEIYDGVELVPEDD